jgi:tetratricopeptide (TPR) repeat protein
MIDEIADYLEENQYHLRRLLGSIEASYGGLNLLICICDNPYYRDEIVNTYEQELGAKGVSCDRVQIDRHQPSLKQSLFNLNLDSNPEQPRIVTVFGIDGLLSVRLEDRLSAETTNRSEQEQFFFSVQWTRESLREFKFPIILWMTESIARELSGQAPDFWSWRGGVFEFVRPVAISGDFGRGDKIDTNDFKPSKSSANPETIQAQIDKILAINLDSPLLRSLYLSLGIAYSDRAAKSITTSRQADLENAISIYQRAIELSPHESFPEDWAMAQYNLAHSYINRLRGDAPEERLRQRAENLELAIECYQLALEVYTRADFPEDWAMTQNNLRLAIEQKNQLTKDRS